MYLVGLVVGQVHVRDAVAVWVPLAPDQDARLTAHLGCQLRMTVGREPEGFQRFVSGGGVQVWVKIQTDGQAERRVLVMTGFQEDKPRVKLREWKFCPFPTVKDPENCCWRELYHCPETTLLHTEYMNSAIMVFSSSFLLT